MNSSVIEAMDHALGETEMSYNSVVNFHEFLERCHYPDTPAMFGWGKYRKTDGDIFDMGIASAKKTLARSAVSPEEIDLVYFCSTCFPGNEIEHIKYNAKLLAELGLTNAFPIGVTLNNCASFLSAMVIATNMVNAGSYNNILVITADKVYDEQIRFQNFALLSDAAASCIITNRKTSGYALVAERFLSSADPIDNNHGKDDSALYGRVFKELMAKAGLKTDEVKKVFCSNIFRPITQLKEMKLGFRKNQLFLENVAKYGHCFSADTVINLIEYSESNEINDGEYFVFSADAPNLRASALFRRVG